jgi:hypothetical protein
MVAVIFLSIKLAISAGPHFLSSGAMSLFEASSDCPLQALISHKTLERVILHGGVLLITLII